MDSATKRERDEQLDDNDEFVGPPMADTGGINDLADDEFVGPPMAAPAATHAKKKRKKKVLKHEQLYLDALPSSTMYECSYMHREVVSHIVVTKTDFIITGSSDGVLMFWKKKNEGGIEFVKTFRSHLGPITGMAASVDGLFLCTASADKSLKIYDILNFDMINMMKLDYTPGVAEWIHANGAAVPLVAVADADEGSVRVYDGRGTNTPVHVVNVHSAPVTSIKFNAKAEIVVSADTKGMIEYWSEKNGYEFPDTVAFEFKSDTDLYEFAKCKAIPWGLAVSPDGNSFACAASDRKVRLFDFQSGKLRRVYDESLDAFSQSTKDSSMNMMELGRKRASEIELCKSPAVRTESVVFDESGNFLIYASMTGIKCVNIVTNKCSRIIGKAENTRFLKVVLYQGFAKDEFNTAAATLEMEVAENPGLNQDLSDPIIFATGYKKSRFYLFSRREPEDQSTGDVGRDVFNLKPTREEQLAASGAVSSRKLAEQVTIHTTLGDITISLFLRECPKTVENFVTHCRDGYYNGLLFHRVIKGFMVQTGDPLGDGTGGDSIWGEEFEDEFNASLRHDRPYTVSMANAGPNTNGSQFFFTLVPTPWLDNKHTVFGRVVKGMETCQEIGNSKTNNEDKPFEDIKIINVSVR